METAGQPCPDAILPQDLPDAQDVQDTQAFGRAAQVSMDGAVVFPVGVRGPMADHGGPRGDRDCALKGG